MQQFKVCPTFNLIQTVAAASWLFCSIYTFSQKCSKFTAHRQKGTCSPLQRGQHTLADWLHLSFYVTLENLWLSAKARSGICPGWVLLVILSFDISILRRDANSLVNWAFWSPQDRQWPHSIMQVWDWDFKDLPGFSGEMNICSDWATFGKAKGNPYLWLRNFQGLLVQAQALGQHSSVVLVADILIGVVQPPWAWARRRPRKCKGWVNGM